MQMIKSMEKAGFKHVLFGLESGAEEILRTSRKAIKKEDAVRAFQLFAKSRIRTTAFLIVGLPGENIETINETIELIQNLQKIKYTLYGDIGILFVYPGTEVYEMAKIKGLLDDSYWMTDKNTPLYTAEHPEETLQEFKEKILNHIALNRIITPAGYIAQKKMIPIILNNHYARMKLINILLSMIINKEKTSAIKKRLGLDRKTRKARMALIKKTFGFTSSSK